MQTNCFVQLLNDKFLPRFTTHLIHKKIRSGHRRSEWFISSKYIVVFLLHSHFLVVSRAVFEEVITLLKANYTHKLEWISCIIQHWVPHYFDVPVCYEFDVLTHLLAIHADQVYGKAFSNELHLQLHCLVQYLVYTLSTQLVSQHAIQILTKFGMHCLVTGYQIVRHSQAVNKLVPRLKPEYTTKRSLEQHAFYY